MKQNLPLKGSLTPNRSTQTAGLEEEGPGEDWRGHDKFLGHIRHTLCYEVTGAWGRVSDLREEGLRLSKETLMLYFPPEWTIGDFTKCPLAQQPLDTNDDNAIQTVLAC